MSNQTPARSRLHVLGTLCGLLLFSTLASNALQNDAPVLLKLKFKPGDVTKYKMTITREMSANLTGQDTPHVTKMVMTLNQKVSKVLPDGGAEVATTIIDQKTTVDDMDTPAQELPTITTVYDAQGNLKSMKGLGEGPGAGIMKGMFGGGMTSGMFSDKPVKVGDSWTLPMKIPGFSEKATVKSTFLKIEMVNGFRTARLRTETTLPVTMLLGAGGSVTNQADAITEVTGTVTEIGEINFAIDEGKIVRLTNHSDINMKMKSTKLAPPGTPESIEMKGKQSMTVEIVP